MVAHTPDIRLIVLVPAELQREAWRALLARQPYLDLAGTACNLTAAEALIVPDQPTSFLIDVPHFDPDLIRQLIQAAPSAGLLYLVESYELGMIVQLLGAGVTGVIARSEGVPTLVRSIIAVARGEIILPPNLARQALLALAAGEDPQKQPASELTIREGEVLSLLAEGLTNKDIAQTLFLSVRTVEAHLYSIYGKLSVSSRTEAALWAVKQSPTSSD